MTHVSNFFNENSNNIEKIYLIEVVDFDGITTSVEVYAYNAEEAQSQAAEIVGNADYTSVIYSEIA